MLGLALCAQQSAFSQPGPTVIIPRLPGHPASQTEEIMDPETESKVVPNRTLGIDAMILEAVRSMPEGGIYSTTSGAILSARRAARSLLSGLEIDPADMKVSFCSGATYLVFLSVIARLNREGKLAKDESLASLLLINEGQTDGRGVWGRWNSNGPGTARLFYEAGLGSNFTSLTDAVPGDFLKVFWNEKIGAGESGHSVIYLGRMTRPDGEFIRYWSSNQAGGYGVADVSLKRIKRMLFSRFENPDGIRRITTLPPRDGYLASLLKKSSSDEEMLRLIGLTPNALHTEGEPDSALIPQKKRNR